MRQRIIMTLAALVCFAMGYAGNISVESISLKPGETKDLKVSLTSAVNEMVGVQFDVTLPEGFSLENSSDDKVYQLSTNQASDLACTVSNLGSGTYRFVLYSNSLKKLKEGELISLNLKASSTMALANYSISISNVAFSDDDGHVTKESGVNVTVKVTDFFTLLYQVDGADYKSYEVEYGAAITAEDNPNKEGYTFSGWSEIPETMPAHDVTVTGTFSINKYKLTYMVDGEEYKTCEIEYGATITAESEPTKEGYTFSGWSEIPETMPAHDVTITGSFIQNIVITAKSYSREYGEDNPTFEFTSEGAALSGTPEITCAATTSSPVGIYPIVIKKGSVTNSYDTYVNGTLTITKAPLKITSNDYSIKQGEALPTFEATYEGFKNSETKDVLTKQPTFTTTATSASEPNTYDIVVSDAEAQNYGISYEKGTLIITEAEPVTITAKSYSREYGEANPTFEFTSEGAALSGTPEITCEATANSPVGTYPIVIKKGTVTNYNDTYVNGTLTITKAPLSVKAGTYTRKQGEDNPEFTLTYEGFKNDETEDVLITKPTATTTATKESTPGEYVVTVSGGDAKNYELSYTNGKLIVMDADAVVITAKSYSREYGEDNPTFEFTSEGAALDGTPEITCEATATSPVGTYPIVIKKGTVTNYNDTYVNGTLTITKAPLTVKVEDATREQYLDNPEFVITYTGWKVDDDESVLTKKPTATTEATEDSPVGTYAIVVSGGEAKNYELNYQNGVLTIIESTGIGEISVTSPADVYTLQGHKVRTKATTLEGLPKGVYIVKGNKVVVK